MKTVNVELRGISPLLQDRPDIEQLQGTGLKRKGQIVELPIENSLHRNGNGVFVPYEWIDRAIKNTAKLFKEPGKRGGNYYKSISGAVRVQPDEIILKPQSWEPFARSLKLKNGNRVPKISPMFNDWSLKFQFEIDDWFAPEVLRDILIEAGRREGIGAWRPACGGRFGRFEVKGFEVN